MSRNLEANYFKDSFKLPNRGLESYFGMIRRGQPDEYRTPFYEGKSLVQILDAWDQTLQSIANEWPTLYAFENDLREKVGPLSIMKPLNDRIQDVDAYYELISLNSKPIDDSAIRATLSEWEHMRGMQIRSQSRVLEVMKKSTNSGSPYFTKRRNVTAKTAPTNCSIEGDLVWQYLGTSQHKWGACAVLGWRGQEGGMEPEDVKQRVVWMFPFGINLMELQVYQPLIQTAQKGNIVPAWVSMDAVDARITQLFDTKAESDLIVCTDFSKFDQHFNESLQSAAYTLLHGLFNHDEAMQSWLTNVFPIKYMIPLAYDWEHVKFGKHGMGSGSGGTNADETLVHRALQYESAILHNSKLNPHSQCLGDDGILSYPGVTVDKVMETYCSHGLEMNQDKQYVSNEDCTYLRRWHHTRYRINDVCVGVYSTFRALGRLCEQERWYNGWSKEMVALRQLSILENVKYHPLRNEFAAFCMKGDKYRLGLLIPGFLDNISSYVEKAMDIMPDFMGYSRSVGQESAQIAKGIQTWWIVNYLKSQA